MHRRSVRGRPEHLHGILTLRDGGYGSRLCVTFGDQAITIRVAVLVIVYVANLQVGADKKYINRR